MYFPSCVSITRPKQIKNLMFIYDAVKQGVCGGRVTGFPEPHEVRLGGSRGEGGIATPLPFGDFFGYFLVAARK